MVKPIEEIFLKPDHPWNVNLTMASFSLFLLDCLQKESHGEPLALGFRPEARWVLINDDQLAPEYLPVLPQTGNGWDQLTHLMLSTINVNQWKHVRRNVDFNHEFRVIDRSGTADFRCCEIADVCLLWIRWLRWIIGFLRVIFLKITRSAKMQHNIIFGFCEKSLYPLWVTNKYPQSNSHFGNAYVCDYFAL